MKTFLSTLCVLALVALFVSSASAQAARTYHAGSLLLDDGFGNSVLINPPGTGGPLVFTWPSSGGTFATTTQLAAYLPLVGGSMSGPILMGNNNISGGNIFTATSFVGALTGNATTATLASHSNLLQDSTWQSPGTIGSVTPNTGAFTALATHVKWDTSAAYTFSASDFTVIDSLASSTVTLPAPTAGRIIAVKYSAIAGTMTVSAPTGSKIDRATSYFLGAISAPGTISGITLVGDGANWWIIGEVATPSAGPILSQ